MRIIRSYFKDITTTSTEINVQDDYYNYFKNVLRVKKGYKINLFNNSDSNIYKGQVKEINNKYITIEILGFEKVENENNYKVNIYQSIIKNENLDLVIQKATELGVNNIYPLISEYTNLKFDTKNIDKKVIRWNKIAQNASEQSGRVFIPTIHEPIDMSEIGSLDGINITLCPYSANLNSITTQILSNDTFNIFIGPEGGFSDKEMAQFAEANFTMINLGKRILKAETAPINILSIINFLKQI